MKILKKLYKINILSIKGIFYLLISILKNGKNLMSLLYFTAKMAGKNRAVTANNETLTYNDLCVQSQKLTIFLLNHFKVSGKSKIAIICRNHISNIKAIFASSQIGANVFLLNPEMSKTQISNFLTVNNIQLTIYDYEIQHKLENIISDTNSLLSYHAKKTAINNFNSKEYNHQKIRKNTSNITVLTGGTSGEIKIAKRKTSIFNFLNPFFALLSKLDLDKFSTVFITTPLYHGFGLSTLIVSTILRSEMFFLEKFNTPKTAEIIKNHNIEVITLVPTILSRLIEYNHHSLVSVKRIITGGAAISPYLVKKTINIFGDVLYNLYGTSEAGFSVMATPANLRTHPTTVGKPIKGVKLKIVDENNRILKSKQTGIVKIATKWAMSNRTEENINTGDLGYKDKNGLLFIVGRADDMIISGGENVYPNNLKNVLMTHKDIKQAAVIGVKNSDFGQRLRAFVVISKNSNLSETEILTWLSGKIARHETPDNVLIISKIPTTPVGKIDTKALKNITI